MIDDNIKPGNLVRFKDENKVLFFAIDYDVNQIHLYEELVKYTNNDKFKTVLIARKDCVLYLKSRRLYKHFYDAIRKVGSTIPANMYIHTFLFDERVCFEWSINKSPLAVIVNEA